MGSELDGRIALHAHVRAKCAQSAASKNKGPSFTQGSTCFAANVAAGSGVKP
eukprot:CAMPEP_0202375102 /NCGR_PEP_ID=MMETSP1127-20130417/5819_1 /ASSEMBLY_ACC=CAM_ASM_000462 /TAXON_ID=3047 /ORGANISM="Dunaliella tertiolecta, Strain CCMP1320" /LENGTH=51 /DNA_ID=CAMNT_0048972461 /DNA_START=71 /DNA_END=223 /DNA_ORIENTATION=+